MSWLQQIIVRLRSIIHREEFEAELDDEIRFHIDMQTEQLVKEGMSPQQARAKAMRAFGGVEQFKEGTRDVRGVVLMETIWQDIRYGFRMLGHSPAFTIVAVVTLALGIGANTAIFSVMNSVLLRPLPYPGAGQIVMLWQANPTLGYEEDQVAVADLHSWQVESQLFSRFGFVVNDAPGTRNHVFHRDDQAERIRGRFASGGLFEVLGVPPLIGRVIQDDEYEKGAKRVAVLSHAFWQRAFNGDPEVIGQTLHIEPMRAAIDRRASDLAGVLRNARHSVVERSAADRRRQPGSSAGRHDQRNGREAPKSPERLRDRCPVVRRWLGFSAVVLASRAESSLSGRRCELPCQVNWLSSSHRTVGPLRRPGIYFG